MNHSTMTDADEERLAQAEEGGDTLGDLPGSPISAAAAGGDNGNNGGEGLRPSLHGLDREFSMRFGAAAGSSASASTSARTLGNNNNKSSGGISFRRRSADDVRQQQQQQRERGPNFNDYLKAQRTLQSRRNLGLHNPSTAALLASMNYTAAHPPPAAFSNNTNNFGGDLPSNNNDNANVGDSQHSQLSQSAPPQLSGSSIQTNLQVASFAAKLRKRASDTHTRRSAEEQKTLRALGQLHKRGSAMNLTGSLNSTGNDVDKLDDWERMVHDLENFDDDGHMIDDGHGGHGDGLLPWYAAPVQRQRWGEDTILPHVNWGDLFFDLFYVAMAYNLGVMLMSIMSSGKDNWLRGCIYYVGIFGALYGTWETSMFYESRYTNVDYAHRLFEVVRYLFVSMAVLQVKPIELLADPKSAETLLFTLAILCEALMHLALNVELYYRGLGDRGTIKNHTLVKIKNQLLPSLVVYVAAFVVAAVLYFGPEDGNDDGGGYKRGLAGGYEKTEYGDDTSKYNSAYDKGDDYETSSSYQTYDSASEPLWKLSDLPLTLSAIGYISHIAFTTIRKMRITDGMHGDIRDRYVPNNVDYVIHRYGEWILLMIGEGILSLLIVETVEVSDYYIITAFGVLTMIFIQILKFESEPTHAQGHAMWRKLQNGMFYSYLIQALSMGLIIFGVTYKVFLKDILKDEAKYKSVSKSRMLAGATAEITDEVSSYVFSISLTAVLLSLELMCLTHSGLKRALKHLIKPKDGGRGKAENTLHWPVVIIALFKTGIMIFTVTLNQWTTDPAELTICGFCVVMALSVTRILNFFFIHKKEVIQNILSVTDTARRTIVSAVLPPGLINESGMISMGKGAAVNESDLSDEKEGGIEINSGSNGTATAGTENLPEESNKSKRRASIDSDTGVIDSSFDGVVIADLNGIISQVNDTTVTLFGYASKKELIGKNLSILVGGGDGTRHDGYVKAFKQRVSTNENPQHKVLGRQRMLRACRADGTEFPCIIGIKMVSNNTKIAGYIRDMSGVMPEENRQVSRSKNEDESINRILEDNAFDAIIVTNNRGIIERVNDRAVTDFGCANKEELVGKSVSGLIPSFTQYQLSKDDGKQMVATLVGKDGKEFKSIVALKKMKGSSNVLAIYVRNIDSLKVE